MLVDTSIWAGHLRSHDAHLEWLLKRNLVMTHPFVIGEIALSTMKNRKAVLGSLLNLPAVFVATDQEVLGLIEREGLFSSGIGYVDVHLLAAARLSGARLWTGELRLAGAAARLGVLGRQIP
jgi:predicted nucleic acid-binding protein